MPHFDQLFDFGITRIVQAGRWWLICLDLGGLTEWWEVER